MRCQECIQGKSHMRKSPMCYIQGASYTGRSFVTSSYPAPFHLTLLCAVVLGLVNANRPAQLLASLCGKTGRTRQVYLPSTGVGLLGPLWRPAHDGGGAEGREVLVEHNAVPVSVTRSVSNTVHPGGHGRGAGETQKGGGNAYASLVSGMSSPHSGRGLAIISSVTCSSALSLSASIQP